MKLQEQDYYLVPALELARWLDAQPADSWWSVDGDTFLQERLRLPCPNDELAQVLRGMAKPLRLVLQNPSEAKGQRIEAEKLDSVVSQDECGKRLLALSWDDSPEHVWILVEDKDISSLVRESDAEARE